MINNENTIIDLLKEFGFSTNAGKAYLSLLKNYPATGYEISTRSGIPRSAVYSVISRLQDHGLINTSGQEPKRYIPIAPSALLEHLSQSHEARIDDLKSAFDKLDTKEEAFDFWHINGYRNLILKMRDSINSANEKIFLSIWAKDYSGVEKELETAHDRGVEIFMFSFCELPNPVGTVVSYNLDEADLLKIWNPKVILVVDNTISIMGSTLDIANSKAIWTRNQAITEIATNHIVLDITLAGQRQEISVSEITENMMRRGDIHLDELLEQKPSSK